MTSPRTSLHLSFAFRRHDVTRVSARRFASSSSGGHCSTNVRVFSGIQPSGTPHLGNYCGAIAKWVHLQSPLNVPNDAPSSFSAFTNDAPLSPSPPLTRLFSVVDLHALTVPFDATHLTARVYSTVAALLGAGIDPQRSIVFRQSHVAAHAELAWLLSCVTPLGWLHRMTQFKQKSRHPYPHLDPQPATSSSSSFVATESSLGLLAYPVLMAADILLYRATLVPVGDDQRQHLELARLIATTFNNRFQRERKMEKKSEKVTRKRGPVLLKPRPMEERGNGHPSEPSLVRIMSLRDPRVKMSKSDASTRSRIELTDSADAICLKIRKATTDAVRGISYDRKQRPGVSNLLDIASAVTGEGVAQLEAQYADYGTAAFKDSVADAVIAKICPIGERIKQYEADVVYLDHVLADGAAQAAEMAAVTMKDVKEVMGLVQS